ncbi:LGFP repeat-containing protein [Neobacillus bataviensis]|uniref:LGFP repeat-containing protein n=1 Tax=Neobacillus bataviensis TaxID=220685 RepID=UPI001CBDA7F5|nr:hypothetical protein [Neobacillus bataviensis]
MYYHPSLTVSPLPFYNLNSYTETMSLKNPYFYPNSSLFPRSFDNLWQGYNNRFSGGVSESPIYWTPQTTAYWAYGGIPTKWTPLGGQANQLGYLSVPQQYHRIHLPGHLNLPGHFHEQTELRLAKNTIQKKWESLRGAPGKQLSSFTGVGVAGSDVEKVSGGYRIRYDNGAIYTKNPGGPAYWVRGFIGQKYDALGGAGSWLGFPTSDEIPLEYEGSVSTFEKGEIYWWPGTDPIDIKEVSLTYSGIHCFGTTSGPGSDEIYAIISAIAPGSEPATAMTRLYKDVDKGESIPDNIELYRGKPYGLTLNFVLFERDQGDPNVYKATVEKSVKAAAGAITAGVGAIASPAAAAAVGPILVSLIPTVSKEINNLLGTADDFLGEFTVTLSMKDMVQLSVRPDELIHNQIRKKLETHLLTGDGGSYKGYFNLVRA